MFGVRACRKGTSAVALKCVAEPDHAGAVELPNPLAIVGDGRFRGVLLPGSHGSIQDRLRLLAESKGCPCCSGCWSRHRTGWSMNCTREPARRALHGNAGARDAGTDYRKKTTPATGTNPRHIHFVRLQAVLGYVRALGRRSLGAGPAAQAMSAWRTFDGCFRRPAGAPPIAMRSRGAAGAGAQASNHDDAADFAHCRGLRLQQPEPLDRQLSDGACGDSGRISGARKANDGEARCAA